MIVGIEAYLTVQITWSRQSVNEGMEKSKSTSRTAPTHRKNIIKTSKEKKTYYTKINVEKYPATGKRTHQDVSNETMKTIIRQTVNQ